MSTQYLGDLSIGVLVPQLRILQLELLLDLQTKLEALLAAQINFTLPTLALSLEAALALVASLRAAITLGMPTLDVKFMADLILELELKVKLLLEFEKVFGIAGLLAWRYDGSSMAMGAELGSAVQQVIKAEQPTQALLLVATVPESFVALGKVLFTG